jgi:hypothetical protein
VVAVVKPVPVTVSVVAAVPALTVAGLMEETVGGTTVGVTGVVVVDEDPAQPVRKSPIRHTTAEREKA